MITYDRESRQLTIDGDDQPVTTAMPYSGHGGGLNNPDMEATHGVGPIPAGVWSIGVWHTDVHLGPLIASLTPEKVPATYKRSGFFIHGDNSQRNHSASHGCIVMDYSLRLAIANSGQREITVT